MAKKKIGVAGLKKLGEKIFGYGFTIDYFYKGRPAAAIGKMNRNHVIKIATKEDGIIYAKESELIKAESKKR